LSSASSTASSTSVASPPATTGAPTSTSPPSSSSVHASAVPRNESTAGLRPCARIRNPLCAPCSPAKQVATSNAHVARARSTSAAARQLDAASTPPSVGAYDRRRTRLPPAQPWVRSLTEIQRTHRGP
jgi:hypothetical protein